MTSYTLSPVWGAGAQLFDNSGNVLTGGKIYTYEAGTTTPASTYTTPIGNTFNSNPIIADASGRLSNEIWLPVSGAYKFVLKDTNDVLIATYDNIPTIPQPPIVNDASSISYEQGYTVTAGAFTVGATYLISSVGTTNFVAIGAATNATGILFTATGVGSGTGTAQYSRTVQTKLRETVSVKDFGAVGDGVANDTVAIQAAVASGKAVFFPQPSVYYKVVGTVTIDVPFIAGAYQVFNPPTITLAAYPANTPATITDNIIFSGTSRPEVNPRWWGAGGSADDSTALQAALWCVTQALPGITVRLEDNVTYTVSTSMVVDTDYFRLTGGPGSTIKRKNNVSADTMTVLTTGFLGRYVWGSIYPLVGMRFDNFEIDGNKANNVIGVDDNFENNFNALYLSESRIENITSINSLRFGIAISNSSDIIAQGNIISACDEGGLYAEVGARIIFDSNRITDTPVAPWNIGSLTFNFISQGVISNNVSVGALDGIYLRNTCDSVSVVGNTIVSTTRYGIWLFDESQAFTSVPKRITISGNTVSGSGDSCVRMQLASQVAVTGNFLRASATDYCIEFNNGSYQTFSGNVCIGYTTQPIKDAGGNTFTEISNLDGTYTPVVSGTTVAGVGTYTAQTGRWSANGNRVSFTTVVTTSAHTGSGTTTISLPFYAATAEDIFIPITLYNTTYTGSAVIAISNTEGIKGIVKIVNPATGGIANLALPAAASYIISGSYQVRNFEY
jgi:hypothetical protein